MVSVNSDAKFQSLSNFRQHVRQNNTTPAVLPQESLTDSFISIVNNQIELDKNGDWKSRNMGLFTAQIPMLLSYIYSGIQLGFAIASLKKGNIKNTILQFCKKFAIATGIGTGLTLAINKYLNNKNSDEKYQNVIKIFNELNTNTDASPAENLLSSNVADAITNATSGKIMFNKNLINDPIRGRNKNLRKVIKHELVHARQYETIARSKDGIKKINYAIMSGIGNSLNNDQGKEYINALYEDINNNLDKYKDTRIKMHGGSSEVNLKNYVFALHTLINKPDATYNDIPIVIDSAHYQKVIEKKGKLTPEEETKADKYYQAMLDYKPVSWWRSLNPWSSYRQNILEKEAYKESPSFITYLSNLFDK